jgi:ABC-2 type transport system ATP-binding protein
MEGVTKRYRGGGGIEDVTLTVGPGEAFAFLGPNGVGKTTTIRVLLDLIRPDAGRIRLLGMDPRRDGTAVRRRLGCLPGELSLCARLTPRELLTHFAHLRGGPPLAEIAELAERLALELDRPIGPLSKANRQKVGLVQALMGRPDLFILDEPTSGLDPLVQQQVLEAIRASAGRGASVLLSSHPLVEVAQVADRVVMLRAGRLLQMERVKGLRERSVHHVEVRLGDDLPLRLEGLSGVTVLEERGARLELEVTGSLDAFVRELAHHHHHLVDLVVRQPSLEELFLSAYGVLPSTAVEERAGRAVASWAVRLAPLGARAIGPRARSFPGGLDDGLPRPLVRDDRPLSGRT